MAELKERFEHFGSFETMSVDHIYMDEGLYNEDKVIVIYRFSDGSGTFISIQKTSEEGIYQLCDQLQSLLADKLWEEVQENTKKKKGPPGRL